MYRSTNQKLSPLLPGTTCVNRLSLFIGLHVYICLLAPTIFAGAISAVGPQWWFFFVKPSPLATCIDSATQAAKTSACLGAPPALLYINFMSSHAVALITDSCRVALELTLKILPNSDHLSSFCGSMQPTTCSCIIHILGLQLLNGNGKKGWFTLPCTSIDIPFSGLRFSIDEPVGKDCSFLYLLFQCPVSTVIGHVCPLLCSLPLMPILMARPPWKWLSCTQHYPAIPEKIKRNHFYTVPSPSQSK